MENQTGIVNSLDMKKIPLRKRPNENSEKIIKDLLNNTKLEILAEVQGDYYSTQNSGNRSDWYKIRWKNQEGYVPVYYIDVLISSERKRGWTIYWTLIFLLVISSLVYAGLHCWVKKNQVKSSAFQEIIDAEKQINEVINSINNTVTHSNIKQTLKNIDESLDSITQKTSSEIASFKIFVDLINSQIQESEEPLSEELQENIKFSLLNIQTRIQQEINQENNSFFWQDKPWLWVEIAFWGWLGTLFYLLSVFYTDYKKDEEEQRFIKLTPWYFITLLRGTFVVFLILLGTTSINLNFGTAASLDFSKIPVETYIFVAGVLGYFNRVAKEQLKFMVMGIFPGAWDTSHKLVITPSSQVKSAYGEHTKFTVDSLEPIEWNIYPDKMGSIIPQQGFQVSYIAPLQQEAQRLSIKQVSIVASLISNPNQTAVVIVTFEENTFENTDDDDDDPDYDPVSSDGDGEN